MLGRRGLRKRHEGPAETAATEEIETAKTMNEAESRAEQSWWMSSPRDLGQLLRLPQETGNAIRFSREGNKLPRCAALGHRLVAEEISLDFWLLIQERSMRFASIAEIKDGLSQYLARAWKTGSRSSSPITASLTRSSSRSRRRTWRRSNGGSSRRRSWPTPGKAKRSPSTTIYSVVIKPG